MVLRAERPVEALLALASEREARMIVVGTFGESPLRSAILGSTPHKLLHLSDGAPAGRPAAALRAEFLYEPFKGRSAVLGILTFARRPR